MHAEVKFYEHVTKIHQVEESTKEEKCKIQEGHCVTLGNGFTNPKYHCLFSSHF